MVDEISLKCGNCLRISQTISGFWTLRAGVGWAAPTHRDPTWAFAYSIGRVGGSNTSTKPGDKGNFTWSTH